MGLVAMLLLAITACGGTISDPASLSSDKVINAFSLAGVAGTDD
jgi:hypothetical protein